jgi:glycerophosphoryl diester phosphodiesterase
VTTNQFREQFHEAHRSYPLVLAHRGDSFRAPENTLEAARLGWESGADGWELDVQLTRDGVAVVIHDDSLARTTDVALRFEGDRRGASGFLVGDFDLAEIRDLDAGSWFLAPAGVPRSAIAFGTVARLSAADRARFASGKVRVPTLIEALGLTLELDWRVNVEVKSFPGTRPDLLDRVLAAIDETGAGSRVLLSSFDHADVARAARLRPEIATGVLAATPLHRPHEYVRDRVGADCYHPSTLVLGEWSAAYRAHPSSRTLRVDDLERLREHGVPVLAYTVNTTSPGGLATHLAEAGVAGLFTDDPRRMRELFGGRRDRG